VAGVVETHGRKETDVFLKKLEVLPKKSIQYRDKELQEFDLDAALLRRPSLLLVDEMAHTNVPGSRHNKRWQDIMELLDRGIDVYTTLNVQHIESLNNIITQITGIMVRETVPDTIFKRANSIELIDLTPDDLIKRLEEGKVYVPSEVGLAIEHFFRKGNLTALLELALRAVAEQVDAEVLLHRRGESIEKIWPTTERLLVCVGPDQNDSKLIRATCRMAESFHGSWIAVFVETPQVQLSEEENRNIIQNLRLAEFLGGENLIIHGTDISEEIIRFSHDRNITKIILGKKIKSRFKEMFSRSLSDELLDHSDDIDLYILRGDSEKRSFSKTPLRKESTPKTAYLVSLATVVFCTLINFGLYKHLELSTLMMVYFLGVIFVSTRGYFVPALLTSLCSVLSFGFFFVHPLFNFTGLESQKLMTLIVMLGISQLFSHLILFAKQQTKASRIREQRTTALYQLSRQLAVHRGLEDLLEITLRHISSIFESDVMVLLPEKTGQLALMTSNKKEQDLNTKERSVAQWVYELGQIAGLGTETLPDSEAVYVPLLGKKGPIGVLRVKPKQLDRFLIPEQLHLLEGFANQTAMALEVDRLEEEAKQTELEIETDRVRNVLLKYIAGNMRAPLTDIMDSVRTLIQLRDEVNSNSFQTLANSIFYSAEELNHLIDNISQIARLEAHEVTLSKGLHTLTKVIDSALKSLHKKLLNKPVKIHIPETMPKISFNKVFMEQVFFNIIENAIKYTPVDTPIEISAILEKERILISIEDQGPGLALEEINKIFEKFYRGQAITHIKGMGLGLSICQRIINLHGGKIWAENRALGGAVFRFTLPLNP